MNTLPSITEQHIRTFVGEQNFQKGQQYARDGAIVHPEQQAMALKAYCYGSLSDPYRVQVTFDGTGITAVLCSCSENMSGYGSHRCEHAAAVYEVVVLETLGHYLSYHDEDGALGTVVQDCVEGLGTCLESEREDEARREQILETIFTVYRFDVDNGGFGLTKDIPLS